MDENKTDIKNEQVIDTVIEKKEQDSVEQVANDQTPKEESVSEEKKGLSEEDLKDDKTEEVVRDKTMQKIPYIFLLLVILGIAGCVVYALYNKGFFDDKNNTVTKTKERKQIVTEYDGVVDTTKDEDIEGTTLRCSYSGNVSDINSPDDNDVFKGYEEYYNYKVDYTFLRGKKSNEVERVRVYYTYYYSGPYEPEKTEEEKNEIVYDDEGNPIDVIVDEEPVEEKTVEEADRERILIKQYNELVKKKSIFCSSGNIDYPFYNCYSSVDGTTISVEYKVSNDVLISKKTILANGLTFNKKMEFEVLSNAFRRNGPNNKSYVCNIE